MTTADGRYGPKTKQGLIFVGLAGMFMVLGTVVFDGAPSAVISLSAAVTAICGGVLLWQGSTEDGNAGQ